PVSDGYVLSNFGNGETIQQLGIGLLEIERAASNLRRSDPSLTATGGYMGPNFHAILSQTFQGLAGWNERLKRTWELDLPMSHSPLVEDYYGRWPINLPFDGQATPNLAPIRVEDGPVRRVRTDPYPYGLQ
ncbi:MAG: hypothetical protein HY053_07940, partial [Proteobacteria bacterium]|nr:hypothetical protein [Pseudomonadota bacterium]